MIDKIKKHYVALTSNADGQVLFPDNDEDSDDDIGNHKFHLFNTVKIILRKTQRSL